MEDNKVVCELAWEKRTSKNNKVYECLVATLPSGVKVNISFDYKTWAYLRNN